MAVSKLSTFEDVPVRLARYFKALAHPARLEIIRVLVQRGTCVCGELVDELPLAQATVSQHLKALREVGLIHGEIDGPAVCYCVDADAMEEMTAAIESYLSSVRCASSCCTPTQSQEE